MHRNTIIADNGNQRMGATDHHKNGASPKNRTSSENIELFFCLCRTHE